MLIDLQRVFELEEESDGYSLEIKAGVLHLWGFPDHVETDDVLRFDVVRSPWLHVNNTVKRHSSFARVQLHTHFRVIVQERGTTFGVPWNTIQIEPLSNVQAHLDAQPSNIIPLRRAASA